jgi:hypothetical protein
MTSTLTTGDIERALGHRVARCFSQVLVVATGRLFRREEDDRWREYKEARWPR